MDRTLVQTFCEALVRRDARVLLDRTEEAFNRGVELKRLTEELALQLRHVLVARTLNEAPSELAESEQKAVLALAKEADAAQLTRLFDVVHHAIWEVGKAQQPRLALEMALLKAVQLAPSASVPELLARVEKLAQNVGSAEGPRPGASGGRSAPAPFRGQDLPGR